MGIGRVGVEVHQAGTARRVTDRQARSPLPPPSAPLPRVAPRLRGGRRAGSHRCRLRCMCRTVPRGPLTIPEPVRCTGPACRSKGSARRSISARIRRWDASSRCGTGVEAGYGLADSAPQGAVICGSPHRRTCRPRPVRRPSRAGWPRASRRRFMSSTRASLGWRPTPGRPAAPARSASASRAAPLSAAARRASKPSFTSFLGLFDQGGDHLVLGHHPYDLAPDK